MPVSKDEMLNSPAFTGTPTAPTATAGTGTTQLATTAFVGTAITNASSTFKKLTADVTSTIDTETVLTDMTFPMLANSIYYIRGRASVGCNGVGGVKMGIKFPAGATGNFTAIGRTANNTSFVGLTSAVSGALPTGLNTVNSQGGYCFIEILLVVGSTAGDFELIFASQTAGQTSTIIAAGTVLEYSKIS